MFKKPWQSVSIHTRSRKQTVAGHSYIRRGVSFTDTLSRVYTHGRTSICMRADENIGKHNGEKNVFRFYFQAVVEK
jgi:hypothetical protein